MKKRLAGARRKRIGAIVCCLLALLINAIAGGVTNPATISAQTAGSSSQRRLAREILKELIEIDTTLRFGSAKAAEAVAARLRTAGFSATDIQLLAPAEHPIHGNLVARLRGKGDAKPVLFLAHLDVVEARKEDWSEGLDPFKFTERDGFFYGRGTVDIKGEAASLVANLIRLRQEGFAPDRDIIVALTADEEEGDQDGVRWLMRNHRDLMDVALAINTDTGGGQIEKGRRVRYAVQTSEKVSINFRLEVKNRGGHSSLPTKDNAIYRLAEGLARLAKFDFPAKLNETTRTFFEKMSAQEKGRIAADMKAVAQTPPRPAAVARLSSAAPLYNSLMRTTCVATLVEAGHSAYALPQLARATVNCRMLPEDSAEEVRRTLVRILADDQITVTPEDSPQPSPAAPLAPEVMRPVERLVAEMWPGVPVVPMMETGATDCVYLRQAGIPTFGVAGVFYEMDPYRAHGKDERIGVEAFHEGVEFMYRLMKALTSGKQ